MIPEILTDESDPRYHQLPPIGQPQHSPMEEEPAVFPTQPEPITTDDSPEHLVQKGQ